MCASWLVAHAPLPWNDVALDVFVDSDKQCHLIEANPGAPWASTGSALFTCEELVHGGHEAFPMVRVNHRGDVVDAVITGALEMAERFELLAGQVERMERRSMFKDEQLEFASQELALRFEDIAQSGMEPATLLAHRRIEDAGDDLWSVLNRVQENLMRGGISRRASSGRLPRTRRITSIREDVRINGRLWDLASTVLAA